MVAVKPGGRPADYPRCQVVGAILYMNRTGCSWRQLLHRLLPGTPCVGTLEIWNADGITDRFMTRCAMRSEVPAAATRRHRRGLWVPSQWREPTPPGWTPAVTTRKSRSTVVNATPRRHLGPADRDDGPSMASQKRDDARLVLAWAWMKMLSIVLAWADGGYASKLVVFAQKVSADLGRDHQTQRQTFHLRRPSTPLGHRTDKLLAGAHPLPSPRPRAPPRTC